MTTEEAIKKEFLEKKKIIIMPSPRGGKMITDPRHIAYFKMDGATTSFCLPRNERGDLVNIFKSDEEKEFFEQQLGLDLNVRKPGNHFEKMQVTVTKDAGLMHKGESYNMSDPMDNLRARILMVQPTVAPSWKERLSRVEYQWAIIDESQLNNEAEVEYNSQQEFWMYLGKIGDDVPKMRQTLMVYFNTISSTKKIQIDISKVALRKEYNEIHADKGQRENFLSIVSAPTFKNKLIVLQALECGAIKKEGNNAYIFTGFDETFTFNDIAERVGSLKESQDNLYFKLIDQIEKGNK